MQFRTPKSFFFLHLTQRCTFVGGRGTDIHLSEVQQTFSSLYHTGVKNMAQDTGSTVSSTAHWCYCTSSGAFYIDHTYITRRINQHSACDLQQQTAHACVEHHQKKQQTGVATFVLLLSAARSCQDITQQLRWNNVAMSMIRSGSHISLITNKTEVCCAITSGEGSLLCGY